MKNKTADSRDIDGLRDGVKALEASEHNPVEWAPIIKFVAPIVARIAARYAMRLIVRKTSVKLSPRTREETVNSVADRLAEIATKRTKKGK